jgi:hypothetical protein
MSPNNRLGTLSVGRLQYLLTPRDLAVIRSVREWRFMTTKQLCSLHFTDHASYTSAIRACNRVLNRLRDHKLLQRLDRPVGGIGGGSTSFVWTVAAAGDRLLRADPDNGFAKRWRTSQPTLLFLEHTLAIADVRVRVEAMNRAGHLELIQATPEPSNWRPYSWAGRASTLKPDLHLVTCQQDEEWHRYVEVDRGTESLRVLVDKKARAYEEYVATGIDATHLGVVPQVLWLMPDERRARRFREELERVKTLTSELHRIITNDLLEQELLGELETEAGHRSQKGGI